MIISKLVLAVLIILAAVLTEELPSCVLPTIGLLEKFSFGLAVEMSLIFLPALLALLAVIVVVSVYAFELQLRLAREVQPMVNLPLPPPESAIHLGTRNSAGVRQTRRNDRDDIKIFYIEGVEMEESQPREPQSQNDVIIIILMIFPSINKL